MRVKHNSNKQVVLVEDDEDLMIMVKSYLEGLNYQVTAFSCGADIFAHLKAAKPHFDLAILDYSLPDMTGDRVAKGLMRAFPVSLPVIFLSAEENLPQRVHQPSHALFMQKPVKLSELKAAVKKLLNDNSTSLPICPQAM
ncbi:MAG: response regulator transcription factor [Bdellovibrionales bacterium]